MSRINEFSQATKDRALFLADGNCENCGVKLDDTYRFHHKIPIQDGGSDDIGNCEVLCVYCHEGSEYNFRQLHPNATPRIMFDPDLSNKEKVRIAKRQQRKYDEQQRDNKKRKTWKRERVDPFGEF